MLAAGNEVGLHGLDAWRETAAARRERALVAEATGVVETGTRMHWLYFDQNSPAILDQAGFSYDSTVGYNETVGYRAGTSQVYKPPATVQLLELPLHVMDTALFYPGYLHLDENSAFTLVDSLIGHLKESGGVLTFNWHDRSLAPERLWGDFYLRLLRSLKAHRTWFPTAGQAVAWFRKRRHATVECISDGPDRVRIRGRLETPDPLPDLLTRIHRPLPRARGELLAAGPAATFFDVRFDKVTELNLNS